MLPTSRSVAPASAAAFRSDLTPSVSLSVMTGGSMTPRGALPDFAATAKYSSGI